MPFATVNFLKVTRTLQEAVNGPKETWQLEGDGVASEKGGAQDAKVFTVPRSRTSMNATYLFMLFSI